MEKRKIGDVEVSPMGIGTWAIGGPFWSGGEPWGWGEADDAESIRAIQAALDAGVTLIDTADVYGAGHAEEIISRALAGRQDQAVVATKWGNTFDSATRHVTGENLSPEYVREAVVASLDRLGFDYIDLLQFHVNYTSVESAAPLPAVCEELVAEGLIRAYGWSTDFPELARSWLGGANYRAVQFQANAFDDAPEMFAFCAENDMAGLNRGPLAMGLLTGKYTTADRMEMDSIRGRTPEWLKYFVDGVPSAEYLGQLDLVLEALTADGRSLVQGALGWLWARSPHALPIPGVRTVAQAAENAGAMEYGPLPADQLAAVEAALRPEAG
jgi:aryl-alcohol dehydrogenase-like predicted oxidoreductase